MHIENAEKSKSSNQSEIETDSQRYQVLLSEIDKINQEVEKYSDHKRSKVFSEMQTLVSKGILENMAKLSESAESGKNIKEIEKKIFDNDLEEARILVEKETKHLDKFQHCYISLFQI